MNLVSSKYSLKLKLQLKLRRIIQNFYAKIMFQRMLQIYSQIFIVRSNYKQIILWIKEFQLQGLLYLLGEDEFLPHSSVIQFMSKLVCDITFVQDKICTNLLFLILGFDREQFDLVSIPRISRWKYFYF